MKFKVGDQVICTGAWVKEYNPGVIVGFSKRMDGKLCNIRFKKFNHYMTPEDFHTIYESNLKLDNQSLNFKTVKKYLGIK